MLVHPSSSDHVLFWFRENDSRVLCNGEKDNHALTSSAIMERKNVLLGITGSVAAVKGPEIAVRLAENGADVKILLTRGGANFWNMAKDYDPTSWAKFESLITPSSFTSYSSLRVDQSVVGNVMLHRELIEYNFFFR